jgi:hypothetical protein
MVLAKDFKKGQMLIEAMIAITVLIFSVFGIFSLISRSLSLNKVVSDQYIGTYLATEGLELVRNKIDTNLENCDQWNKEVGQGQYDVSYKSSGLLPFSGTPLHYDNATHLYSYSGGVITRFYRTVYITPIGDDGQEVEANSIVSWSGRGGAQSTVNIEDRFFNWRSQPAKCTP